MLAKCYSGALCGVNAQTVEIEVCASPGSIQFALVGCIPIFATVCHVQLLQQAHQTSWLWESLYSHDSPQASICHPSPNRYE